MTFGLADPAASGNLVVDRRLYQSSEDDIPVVVNMLAAFSRFPATESRKARILHSIHNANGANRCDSSIHSIAIGVTSAISPDNVLMLPGFGSATWASPSAALKKKQNWGPAASSIFSKECACIVFD